MHKKIHIYSILILIAALGVLNSGCTAKIKESYHMRQADKYFNAGDYQRAEIEYKNAIRNDNKNSKAWGRLGSIYFDQGRFLMATPVLLHAQSLDTNNPDVRLKLGYIYLAASRLKDARSEADTILALNPQNRLAPILLAQATLTTNDIKDTRNQLQKLSANGDRAALAVAAGILSLHENDLNSAATDLNNARSLDPKFSEAYWALGDLSLARKDLKQADGFYKTAADLAPLRSGKKLQYAQFKIATGDTDTGRGILEGLVKDAPDYLPAWVSLARLSVSEKKYDDAESMLERVLANDAYNYDAILLDAQLKLDQNKADQAVVLLKKIADRFPQSPRLQYQLAVAYLANKDIADAKACLSQALQIDPKNVDATLLLAQVQIRSGDAASGITALKRLIGQQPELAQAKLLLAEAYQLQKDFDSAVQTYGELAQEYPKEPQIYLLMGMALVQQNKSDQARVEFEKAFELSQNKLPALEQLVNLDLAGKQYATARQRVEQQQQADPKSGAFQLLLAKISAAEGKTELEESELSKAIEFQPDSPMAYQLLAQLYGNSHQDQKALSVLKAGLETNPQNLSLLMFLGMVYGDQKDYKDAAEAYQKLLDIDPNFAMALNNLACLYSDQLGQLDDAYQLAERAKNLQPADPAVSDTLGWILYKKKDYASALPLLQQSAIKLTEEPEVQYHLGATRYMMGNEAEARAVFQRTLQLNKDFQDRDQCEQCLAVLNVDVKTAGADVQSSLEKRVAGHPDDLVALLRLAAIYQWHGDGKKAAETYEAALAVDPQSLQAMINLARLYAGDNTQKAFELAKNAYKLAPEDPIVSLTLGGLAYQTGDDKWAYTLLLPASENNTAGPDTLYQFGMAAYDLGKISDAVSAMQTALQSGTNFANAGNARRFLDLQTLATDPAKAVADESQIAEILKSNPDYVPALILEGLVNEQKSNPGAAEQLYEKVLGQHPDFAPAQRRLAILYSEDPSKDKQTYDLAVKARQAYPDDPNVARALGIVTYRMASAADDYARAADLLAESARSQPQDAGLLYYLGMAQYHLKQQAECKSNLNRALALHLSGQSADEARRILKGLK